MYADQLKQILIRQNLSKAWLILHPTHIVFPILEMEGTIPLELLGNETNLYTGVVSDDWIKPFKQS